MLHWRVLLASAAGALAAAAGDDRFLFLDNGMVRVGVDATRGGSIGWLSASGPGARNLVNHADMGREVQLSFYAGPDPYNPDDKCHSAWYPWPWNPIGAGDVAGNSGAVLEVANTSTSILVRSRPLQWACTNVSCECEFIQNVSLAPGAQAVVVHAQLLNARADGTDYGAKGQELPAMYGIGDLHLMKTYRGAAPWTSAPVETLDTPAPQPPWAPGAIDITEGWGAFVDASDAGWGFYSPRYAVALAGFHGAPGGNASTDSCGYYAPTAAIDLTHNASFGYDFALVLGSTAEVRAYAYAAHAATASLAAGAEVPPYADWSRERDRHEWVVVAGAGRRNTTAAASVLRVDSTPRGGGGRHAVRLVGPAVPWSAEAAPTLALRLAAVAAAALATGCETAEGAAAGTGGGLRASVTFVRAGEPVYGDAALAPLLAASARRIYGAATTAEQLPGAVRALLPLPAPPADGYGGALAAGAGGPGRAVNATLPMLACAAAPALSSSSAAAAAAATHVLRLAGAPGYSGLLLQLAVDLEAGAAFSVDLARLDLH